jgi:hypothetical protein
MVKGLFAQLFNGQTALIESWIAGANKEDVVGFQAVITKHGDGSIKWQVTYQAPPTLARRGTPIVQTDDVADLRSFYLAMATWAQIRRFFLHLNTPYQAYTGHPQ